MEDLIIYGRRILKENVKPESFQQAKELFGNKDFEDPSKVASHFQALKGVTDNNKYQSYYSAKKRFMMSLSLR